MSTTITVEGRAPALAALVAAIDRPEVRIDRDDEIDGVMAPGLYNFILGGISTRATEVTIGAGTIEVRIFSMASPDDVDLAMRIARGAASLCGAIAVDAEGLGEVAVADLATTFDRAWAEHQVASGLGVLRAFIADGRGPIALPGPRRDFTIGSRLLAELDAAGDPATTPARVLAAMRAVQWLRVRTAAVFLGTRSDGTKFTLAPWLGDEVVFPAVDYAAINDDSGAQPAVFLIEQRQLVALAGARWRPIDEQQGHLTAMGDDWAATVVAARALAVTIA